MRACKHAQFDGSTYVDVAHVISLLTKENHVHNHELISGDVVETILGSSDVLPAITVELVTEANKYVDGAHLRIADMVRVMDSNHPELRLKEHKQRRHLMYVFNCS